jgi:hypothetical protein
MSTNQHTRIARAEVMVMIGISIMTLRGYITKII